MINIIDLFSGAGGLTEGFRTSKYNLVTHVEQDTDACKTLRLRDAFYYLKKKGNLDYYSRYLTKGISYSDFMEIIPKEIKDKVINCSIGEETLESIFSSTDNLLRNRRVHGIIGGPPCQAYSTIGRARNKQNKANDERIYLYKYYIEFLRKYNPDFFIFENVKGLLSFKDIHGEKLLPQILEDFSNACGCRSYNIDVKLVDCAEFGIPQHRQRLIIFGQKQSKDNFDFFTSLSNKAEIPPTIGELFTDLPCLKSGEQKNHYGENPSCNYVKDNLKTRQLPLSQNISRKNNENDLKIYKIVAKKKKEGRNIKYCDLPDTLKTHKNKKEDIFSDRFKAIDENGLSHTIVAHIAKDGHYYIHPDIEQNRSITVREAARIQTFPDDFHFEASRTAAFKQIGNAVPPHLSKKISEVILEYFAQF
ncbi:DNA cytosine methyltransferase [Enterococcus avium]|uniref:DNA cytosine methyltransferase n=1 Tax=Enterococcus avium TaxID=33945 RepID=UPI001A96D346|nr:DNA cytosine methyltransferase [Enterococcus avium]MBO1142358.1 DNA cytosine methyltransferase [Enterococcus avium]